MSDPPDPSDAEPPRQASEGPATSVPVRARPSPSVFVLRRLSFVLGPLLVLVLFGGLYLMQRWLDWSREAEKTKKGVDELMYFPSGRLLTEIAGEYRLLVADYAWLRATQYYAYHLARDQNYQWFGHICQTTGQLDPRFIEAWRFGSLILAWDSNKPDSAIDLLRMGMEQNPLNWELPFQIAFVAYVRQKDYRTAEHYFNLAARLPDVWSIVPRWAAIASQKSGDREVARAIWTELWHNHPNEKVRAVARKQLVDMLRQELAELQTAVDSAEKDKGERIKEKVRSPNLSLITYPLSFSSLIAAGYLTRMPVEPFGGSFSILRSGRVISTSVENTRRLAAGLQRLADRYRLERGSAATDMDDLIRAGYLKEVPADPFGGIIALEAGKVRLTLDLP